MSASGYPVYSPHGAVGEPSPVPSPLPDGTMYHHPSSIYAPSQMGRRSPLAQSDAHDADLDLSTLLAEAHKQQEAEKESFGSTFTFGNLGNGVLEHSGYGMIEGATRKTSMAEAPPGLEKFIPHHRSHNSEVWDRYSAKATQRLSIKPPQEEVLALSASVPKTAPPMPLFQPFPEDIPSNMQQEAEQAHNQHSRDSSMPMDFATQAEQIAHHVSALSGLVGPMIASADDNERLRKEVEIWKLEWNKAEREKRKVQGLLDAALKGDGKVQMVPSGGRFTAVLIDGDGLIFEDHLLQQGSQGGQHAARALLSALPKLFAHIDSSSTSALGMTRDLTIKDGVVAEVGVDGDGVDEVMEVLARSRMSSRGSSSSEPEKDLGSVVVQVFLNKSGLGATMVKTGTVPSWSVFDSFWHGFSASHELFNVIDVGAGKEASDAKIRDFLKLYSKNAQCEMIVLGASHDNGYANVLSSLQTESRLSKLLLLKGYSDLAPQLRQYSSRVVTIPDLFRTSRLVVPTGIGAVPLPSSPSPSQPQSFSAILQQPAKPRAVTPLLGISVQSNAETSSNGSVEVFEWQGGVAGKDKSKKDNAGAVKGKKDDGWTEAKKPNRKLLKKGVTVNTTVRNLRPRPCHAFYLGPSGDCRNGEDCEYGHHYKLNAPQLDELAKLAKEMLCPYVKNNKCRFGDDCVYGHQCPRIGSCTFGETCRFRCLPNGHGELDDVVESD